MPSGGYRQPSNPAPVSGPGAHSQRTDGGPSKMALPDAKYGEAADFQQIQQGASLGNSPSSAASGTQGVSGMPMPTPLSDPSAMPGQPVTAGADAGAGPDSSTLGLPQQSGFTADVRKRLGPLLPWLIRKADDPHSSQEFRDQVRFLIANL